MGKGQGLVLAGEAVFGKSAPPDINHIFSQIIAQDCQNRRSLLKSNVTDDYVEEATSLKQFAKVPLKRVNQLPQKVLESVYLSVARRQEFPSGAIRLSGVIRPGVWADKLLTGK